MEKIEQQINMLKTEIEEVSSDIMTIVLVLKKDFRFWSEQEKIFYGYEEVEAKKQLRRKEEQLRSEKEQLRRKEEQLRELLIEKERQRTQGMIMKGS